MGPTGSFIVFGVQLLFFTDTVDSWEAGDAGLVLAGTRTVFFGWCWVFLISLAFPESVPFCYIHRLRPVTIPCCKFTLLTNTLANPVGSHAGQ